MEKARWIMGLGIGKSKEAPGRLQGTNPPKPPPANHGAKEERPKASAWGEQEPAWKAPKTEIEKIGNQVGPDTARRLAETTSSMMGPSSNPAFQDKVRTISNATGINPAYVSKAMRSPDHLGKVIKNSLEDPAFRRAAIESFKTSTPLMPKGAKLEARETLYQTNKMWGYTKFGSYLAHPNVHAQRTAFVEKRTAEMEGFRKFSQDCDARPKTEKPEGGTV